MTERFVDVRPLLKMAGSMSHERMQQIAHERYADLDTGLRQAEALAADPEDINELKRIQRDPAKKGSGR